MPILTKLQRNQLYEALDQGGLQQAMCTWVDPETDDQFDATYAVIRQDSSDSHFMVWPDTNRFGILKVRMKIGSAEATHLFEASWNEVLTVALPAPPAGRTVPRVTGLAI